MKKSISATITASRLIIINDQNKGISVSGADSEVASVHSTISTKKIAENKMPMKVLIYAWKPPVYHFARSISFYRLAVSIAYSSACVNKARD